MPPVLTGLPRGVGGTPQKAPAAGRNREVAHERRWRVSVRAGAPTGPPPARGLRPLPDGRRRPQPGGRPPGEVAYAEAEATLAGRRVHGLVCSWIDTAGIHRIKAVPVGALDSVVAEGVGMSPVFDTFLADDSIVATDVLGGPDGDLRLSRTSTGSPSSRRSPGWAWAPVDRLTQEGGPHPACTRTLLRRQVAAAPIAASRSAAAIEIEFALGRGDAPDGEFVAAVHADPPTA